MSRKTKYVIFLTIAVFLVLPQTADAQCAMCKAVTEGGRDIDGFSPGAGINKGILYLMGIPYICLFILFRTRMVSFFREFRGLYQ